MIDGLPHVDLGRLVTLDFARLVPAPHRWSHPTPIVFDEEGGLAIAGIEAGALDFVAEHGLEHLYEVSTF